LEAATSRGSASKRPLERNSVTPSRRGSDRGINLSQRDLPHAQRVAAHTYSDIRYWGKPTKGGHFGAFEQPELFADEVRAFFRLVR
jgi:pimeloyl-ACP methyl ester carboxylesterase